MIRILSIGALIVLFSYAGFLMADPGSETDRPAYLSDTIKIQLTADAVGRLNLPTGLYEETASFGHRELDALLEELGGTGVIRAHRRVNDKEWEAKSGFDRWFLIRLDGRISAEDALAIAKANPWIENASLELLAYLQTVPNDPYYNQNWGHNNTGQGPGGGGNGFDSNAPEAWDDSQGFGSADVIIAIVDSGVNYNHADLNDNCVPGYDYGANDNNPMDTNGHGSQCAGVAAGEVNNSIGVAGVAGGCKIMPLKAMNNSGELTFTGITNCITHAADNGAHVISLSLGAENNTEEGDYPSCDAALTYAYNAGVTIFAATANSNTSVIAYPANHTAVISVGAASPTGQRKSSTSSDGEYWWGSNYGVNIQDAPKAVDIMAATILPATTMSGGYSTTFNGTSCATPYAAGVAALVISKAPGSTPAEVRQAIVSTATDMTIDGGAGWDRYTGYGMINASAAVASIAPGMPVCTIISPTEDSVHLLGSTVSINVNASDTNGFITEVSFYIDGALTPVFTDDSPPYLWHWDTEGQSPWEHTVRAVATDNENNSRQDIVSLMLIAPANEGFEGGFTGAYPWVSSGSSPWNIQAEQYFSGIQAAKAGSISHNQSSSLSLSLNILAEGEISFFSKVSCEPNYDYLRFFMDDVQVGQWTGEVGWARHFYPVNPGLHSFTWTYVKDQGVSSGSDTAWLDHINFPPHNAPPAAPTNLIAQGISPTKIQLHWIDSSTNETEFFVEVLNGSVWELVNWVPQDVTMLISDGLNPSTTYSYRVKAVIGNTSSYYSNVATATTLGPDCVDELSATANANQVNLTWSAPQTGADTYQVWRFSVLGGTTFDGVPISFDPVSELAFTDSEWHLQAPGEYLWKVMASSGSNQSAPSWSNSVVKVANGTLRGVVQTEDGGLLEDAIVSCGSLSTSTNSQGEYTLSLLPGSYTVTVSFPGYIPLSLNRVVVQSGQESVVNFTLQLIVPNVDELAPALFGIQNIYPNPFRNNTSIELSLKDDASPYTLSIYNLRGELLYRQTGKESGKLTISWDGKDKLQRIVAAGLYFIRLEQGSLRQLRKLVRY
jgi:subtilisin family serine protease